jgi:hypothetical protein
MNFRMALWFIWWSLLLPLQVLDGATRLCGFDLSAHFWDLACAYWLWSSGHLPSLATSGPTATWAIAIDGTLFHLHPLIFRFHPALAAFAFSVPVGLE